MSTENSKTTVSPVRLEYPARDYWDEVEQALDASHLPMIVFDLDGTLLDSYDLSIEGHRQVIERLGLPPVPTEVLVSLNGPTSEQALKILGLDPGRLPEFESHMREVDNTLVRLHAKLFPGVRDMLAELYGRATLCLLTNGSPHYVAETSNTTGIARYFDHIQGFVPGMDKAKRLLSWKERYQPPRMMMAGDRPTDIQAAREAGILDVAVLYGAGGLEELSGAAMIARHVDELRRICLAFCEL